MCFFFDRFFVGNYEALGNLFEKTTEHRGCFSCGSSVSLVDGRPLDAFGRFGP